MFISLLISGSDALGLADYLVREYISVSLNKRQLLSSVQLFVILDCMVSDSMSTKARSSLLINISISIFSLSVTL